MITAIDTSVLVAIYKGETDGSDWLDKLQAHRQMGRLIVCEVVLAELAAMLIAEKEALIFLEDLDYRFDAIRPKAAILAGQIFRAYRRTGGPREHLIPDFLIGAHALIQAEQLAAADQGYLRRYFPKLKVITPKAHE